MYAQRKRVALFFSLSLCLSLSCCEFRFSLTLSWVVSICIRRFRFPPVSYCFFLCFSNIPKYFRTMYWIVFFSSHDFVSHFSRHWTHKHNDSKQWALFNALRAFVCVCVCSAVGGKYYQRHTLSCSVFADAYKYNKHIYRCIFKNTFSLFSGAQHCCWTTSRHTVPLSKAMNCHFTHAVAVLMYVYVCTYARFH